MARKGRRKKYFPHKNLTSDILSNNKFKKKIKYTVNISESSKKLSNFA